MAVDGTFLVMLGCSSQDDMDVSIMASQLIPLLKEGFKDPDRLSRLKGIKGVFQLNLMQNNKKAGTWHVIIDGDKKEPQIVEGPSQTKPTLATTISDEMILKLAVGKENPIKAFMSGKLKLQGNLMLAQRLEAAFRSSKGYEQARVFATEFVNSNEYLKSKL